MKNLILACFFIFSFEEAFSQARYINPHAEKDLKNQSGDAVMTGQSATVRKTNPAPVLKEIPKSNSINGVNCMDSRGEAFAPNSKGYKKCVDNANRVQ